MSLAVAVLRAPLSGRAGRDLLFCLAGVGFGLAVLALPYALFGVAYAAGAGVDAARGGAPQVAVAAGALAGLLVAVVALVVGAAPAGRALGALHRALARGLLGAQVPAPSARRFTGGPVRRLGTLVSDGPGWRGVAYSLLKLPLGVIEAYGVVCWAAGLVDMTYPFWWRLFRNHPPGVQLEPVPVVTPFGAFRVATFPGTFAALAAGAAMLLAAPWLARGAASVDLAAMRGLLGPGRLAQRVQHLRDSRAVVIDDAAATLRRLERDLHDGAQIRLATLAMHLGMASEKLGGSGQPPDLDQARDLVVGAHRGAKDALVELRDLVRGIHPPVLDNGLPDALATLAAASAVPVTLRVDVPHRPAPAIETIAYFCTAELLANAAKHSQAGEVAVTVTERDGRLRLSVTDDGVGGAEPARGTGLAGLVRRVRAVDGRMAVASPPGGPTRIRVDLPLRP